MAGSTNIPGPQLAFSPLDADLLLAPSLKTFRWCFTCPGTAGDSLTNFGAREGEWLREFARAAIARGSTLKEIQVRYNPRRYWAVLIKRTLRYPWDLMDEIRAEIQPHGLALEFTEPAITKEEWLRLPRKQEP